MDGMWHRRRDSSWTPPPADVQCVTECGRRIASVHVAESDPRLRGLSVDERACEICLPSPPPPNGDSVTTTTETASAHLADKNACGTCRTRTAAGKPVEHEECAARAQLIEAPDAPGYEALTEMTMEQKAALPARFHIPVFDDCGSPKLWLCAVCWEEGVATGWPCATANKRGTEVFTR